MFDDYPSVSEIYATARLLTIRHPQLCALRRVGGSRLGEDLLLLSVGHGRRNVLVVAGPHANERVGGATALSLATRIVGDSSLHGGERDSRWHFLLCLDPDGTRMNETFVPRGHTLNEGYRPFFRPVGHEQPEWAPSIHTGTARQLPESRALIELIDEIRPFLQCSLHANDVGGGWVQLTRDLPGLADPFSKAAADLGIPLEIGSIDTMFWRSSGPGVFVMPEPGIPERFASFEEDAARSTWYRPHRYGGMTAVIEAPMWASHLVDDSSPAHSPRRAMRHCARLLRHRSRRVAGLLESVGELVDVEHSAVLRGARAAVSVCPGLAADWDQLSRVPARGPAPVHTAGHLVSLAGVSWRIPLRAAAMALTALGPLPGPRAAHLRRELDGLVSQWCAAFESEFQARWVPVDDQVTLQARTVLALFDRLTI
ncbi:3-hydroxyacyl-CoA dehydrogenase [Streptomyces sp. N2-109]|uniref:3-hydroxyacyl-CoA dehydrogenase n=1 Tax=Streptomyces gossypii TaxID=2883101 RepID=A0ABT2JPA2_9ACTN|nr:M14 family zinc carboxypeptidase [Streptomyces gossypii]MCT2589707.1 3-hydroxyacyl-CoA dehydrogenase [Streptomyces gossypii]